MVFADECSSVKILSLNVKFDNWVHKILKGASVETTKPSKSTTGACSMCAFMHTNNYCIVLYDPVNKINGSHLLKLLEGIAHLCSGNI